MIYPILLSRLLTALILITAVAHTAWAQTVTAVPREKTLLNGLKLLMFDAPTSDKVTLKVRLHAGSAFDPQGKEGLMRLLAANIFPEPTAKEFFSEQLGGSLEVISNYDFIQVNATSKPESMLNMLETVAGAIANIDIDKAVTARLKADQIKRIAELSRDPVYVVDQAASSRLLGTFPYGRPEDGTTASIEQIDFADLLAAKQRFLTADNSTVVMSGKFDNDLAFRAVRRYFGAWLKADKLVPSTFKQPDPPPSALLVVESPLPERFEARFITRGTSRSSNDLAAYRIAAKVVEKRLKSFAEGSSVLVESSDHVLPGTFTVRLSGPKDAPVPKIEANEFVMRALSGPITNVEFQTARQSVMADLEKQDIFDRWLDVDTFKAEIPSKVAARASNVSLTDVQDVMARLQKQPFAAVVSSPAKAAN